MAQGTRVCVHCGREFLSGQALGGHIKVHNTKKARDDATTSSTKKGKARKVIVPPEASQRRNPWRVCRKMMTQPAQAHSSAQRTSRMGRKMKGTVAGEDLAVAAASSAYEQDSGVTTLDTAVGSLAAYDIAPLNVRSYDEGQSSREFLPLKKRNVCHDKVPDGENSNRPVSLIQFPELTWNATRPRTKRVVIKQGRGSKKGDRAYGGVDPEEKDSPHYNIIPAREGNLAPTGKLTKPRSKRKRLGGGGFRRERIYMKIVSFREDETKVLDVVPLNVYQETLTWKRTKPRSTLDPGQPRRDLLEVCSFESKPLLMDNDVGKKMKEEGSWRDDVNKGGGFALVKAEDCTNNRNDRNTKTMSSAPTQSANGLKVYTSCFNDASLGNSKEARQSGMQVEAPSTQVSSLGGEAPEPVPSNGKPSRRKILNFNLNLPYYENPDD